MVRIGEAPASSAAAGMLDPLTANGPRTLPRGKRTTAAQERTEQAQSEWKPMKLDGSDRPIARPAFLPYKEGTAPEGCVAKPEHEAQWSGESARAQRRATARRRHSVGGLQLSACDWITESAQQILVSGRGILHALVQPLIHMYMKKSG